ncbi:MAG: glycogen debranching protein GlgX [Deltaproteobacteria bacterium]|nr:glycogen debranching protein GlgX [Deltaproteobacteria bacterium]
MKFKRSRLPFQFHPGKPLPLGATLSEDGVQFSIFSRHATSVILQLFNKSEDQNPSFEIELDPEKNKTGDIWHVFVKRVNAGQLYGYRVDGPYKPKAGMRFNKNKLLLDPYSRAVTGNFNWDLSDARGYDIHSPEGDLSFCSIDSAKGAPKCIVVDESFEWGDDRPLRIPLRDTIIYETHVRGLTCHPASQVKHPGTFQGVVEKIPYLKELGITAVELLPIQEFDESEITQKDPTSGKELMNYWGYSTLSFFAPKGRYSSSGTMGEQVVEFKKMVRELHRAGIEVILDVVFNHTAEGDETGPTLCFRGLDNKIYYMLLGRGRRYENYSGCGNTFNCNHPLVRGFILDCLRYWVVKMHVDGFRFDLASILGRDQNGKMLENPPLIERIAEDPVLRDAKIIAEAWDAAGAYQVGSFPGKRWAEWNGRFRDDIRRFWRGDPGMVSGLATRLAGSSDLYQKSGRAPFHSINFITCHDGFTLHDLQSYAAKHNETNGGRNKDGADENFSCNYGVEGETDNSEINTLRTRQIKNFLATLMLSQGVPMLLGGDEFRRTQRGNNNAYCQNNEVSWYNWNLVEENKDVFRFTKEMIAFRKRHPSLRRERFFTGKDNDQNGLFDITWYSKTLHPLHWSKESRSLAYLIDGSRLETGAKHDDNDLYLIFNASEKSLTFSLPELPSRKKWWGVIDTSLPSPRDIVPGGKEIFIEPNDRYLVAPRTTVVLISKP